MNLLNTIYFPFIKFTIFLHYQMACLTLEADRSIEPETMIKGIKDVAIQLELPGWILSHGPG